MFYLFYLFNLGHFFPFCCKAAFQGRARQPRRCGLSFEFCSPSNFGHFYMIFMFLLQGGIPKKSKAVGWRRVPHSSLLGLTFPFAQGQPALPYQHHLCFFLTTIIPENHHFCFFSASRTITSSLSSSSPILSLSIYIFSFFVFNINKKTWFDFPFF